MPSYGQTDLTKLANILKKSGAGVTKFNAHNSEEDLVDPRGFKVLVGNSQQMPVAFDKLVIPDLTAINNSILLTGIKGKAIELPFVCVGVETRSEVRILKIVANYNAFNSGIKNEQYAFSDFNPLLNDSTSQTCIDVYNTLKRIKDNSGSKPIVISGHTHPYLGSIWGTDSPLASGIYPSLGDFRSLDGSYKRIITNNYSSLFSKPLDFEFADMVVGGGEGFLNVYQKAKRAHKTDKEFMDLIVENKIKLNPYYEIFSESSGKIVKHTNVVIKDGDRVIEKLKTVDDMPAPKFACEYIGQGKNM